MRQIVVLLSLFIFLGCSQKVSKENIQLLNGYWEIDQVAFPNGDVKEFNVNPTIDYLELDGLKGFRKKMYPKFDGSYTTSNDAEVFVIMENERDFEFHYKNEMSAWKERITFISENQFSVVNNDTLTYTYKRFQPINAKE